MTNIKVAKTKKVANNFNCIFCDYNTCKKTDYIKHLSTLKHKKREYEADTNNTVAKISKVAKKDNWVCGCGKEYKHQSSLWNHKQKCEGNPPNAITCVEILEDKPTTDTDYKNIIMTLVNDNKEMQKIMLNENKELRNMMTEQQKTITEMIPHMGNNTTNNNTINNNQKFNINVFLNEKCKDAINMSDFIKSIEVSVEQLQYTTNNGLEKGISQVIMDSMNKLSLYERPVHCTDAKRETIYIKDNDKWEKDKDKKVLKKAINKASGKNYTALTEWTKDNPNFMKCDDKQMFYAKTVSAIGKPIDGVNDKIVKKICSNTYMKGSLENHD